MDRTTYGLDTATHVFQVYWVDIESGEIGARQLKRAKVLEFFAKQAPGRVVLEACGGSHWWARQLQGLGHEVKLMHAKYVRPFVQTNKTDAADAQAIWTAAHQPKARFVALKSEQQQAVLGLHGMREQLVKFRTMQVNGLRGLLCEHGVVIKAGRMAGLAELRARSTELEERLPGLLWQGLRDQLVRLERLEQDIKQLERSIDSWHKQDARCERLDEIPGVAELTATALVATIGEDPKVYR